MQTNNIKTNKNIARGIIVAIMLLLGIIFSASVPLSAQALSIKDGDTRGITLYLANQLKVGDYVENFGSYNSNNLRWRVVSNDDEGLMLELANVLSDSKGQGMFKTFSIPTSTTINVQIANYSMSTSKGGDREKYGTNYWDVSSMRNFLRDDFYEKAFSGAQRDLLNPTPKVKTLLYWTEVDYTLDRVKTLFENMGNGQYFTSWKVGDYEGDNIATDRYFKSAASYSGKTTWMGSNSNGAYISRTITPETVQRHADNNAYYYSNDPVFLAPAATLVDSKLDDLKNTLGQSFNIKQDVIGTARNAWSSTPAFNIENDGTQLLYYTELGTISAERANGSNTVAPSVYLGKNTVLKRTGTRANPNEKETYYTYDIASSQNKVPPTITTTELPHATVGVEYSAKIATNTDEVALSVTGSLPTGLTLDENTNTIKGIPTRASDNGFTINAINAFGTDIKSMRLVVDKGNYQGITSPTVSAVTGDTTDTIVPPDGWRFAENVTFDAASTPFVVAGLYNRDPSNYNDYSGTIIVNVGKSMSPAPSQPISMTYKVGQRVGDTPLNDDRYKYVDSDIVFNQVGKERLQVWYNADSDNNVDLMFGLDVTIIKGEAQQPSSKPSLTATYGQTASNIGAQLPSGWRFEDNKLFDKVGKDTVNALYSIDSNNYEEARVELEVTVDKAVSPDPDKTPDIEVRVGDALSTYILPDGFRYQIPNQSFESAGERYTTLIYNPNADNYKDQLMQVSVRVVKYAAQNPGIMLEVDSVVGVSSEQLGLSLPKGWYVDQDINFEQATDYQIKGYYNIDLNKYENYSTTILVHVYKAKHDAPINMPTFAAHVGDTILDLQGQLDALNAQDGRANAYYFDREEQYNVVFDTVRTEQIILYYNTDANNYLAWSGLVNVYVDLYDAQIPSVIPGLRAKFGTDSNSIMSQLPEEWSFVENVKFEKPEVYDTVSDAGVDIRVAAVYNIDKDKYKDYEIELVVRVTIQGAASTAPSNEFVAEVAIGDQYNKIKLPDKYSWKTDFDTSATVGYSVGEFLVEVNYNFDPNQFYAITTPIKIVVSDGYLFFRLYNQGKLNIPFVAMISILAGAGIAFGTIITIRSINKRRRPAYVAGGLPRGAAYGNTMPIQQLPPSTGYGTTRGYGNTTGYGQTSIKQLPPPPPNGYGTTRGYGNTGYGSTRGYGNTRSTMEYDFVDEDGNPITGNWRR